MEKQKYDRYITHDHTTIFQELAGKYGLCVISRLDV